MSDMDRYSVDSCDLCTSAAPWGPTCGDCGRRVAPAHLIVDVHRREHEEWHSTTQAIYPSGNPATGPTYLEPRMVANRYVRYEYTYADGHVEAGSGDRRSNQCDHCHLLNKAISSTRAQLNSLIYPAVRIPSIRWRDVLLRAWTCALLSVIPLGFLMSAINSYPALLIGMLLAGFAGGFWSFQLQIAPIERAERQLDAHVKRHEEDRANLENTMKALTAPRDGNRTSR